MEYVRLTSRQKSQLNEVFDNFKSENYDSNNSEKLNDAVYKELEDIEHLKDFGDEYILISKPEVHEQVWTALNKADVGKVVSFENGDSDPNYNKGMLVNKTLFESLLDALLMLINKLLGVGQGAPGAAGDGRSPSRSHAPSKDAESTYGR